MRRNRSHRWVFWVLFFIAFLSAWYMIASDYGYKALAGTYTLRLRDETSTLILRSDGSFQQEMYTAGKVVRATGSWRLFGEGHVAISPEFLKIPNQEVAHDGEVYGQAEKKFGLFLVISFSPDPGGPTYRKKLFS